MNGQAKIVVEDLGSVRHAEGVAAGAIYICFVLALSGGLVVLTITVQDFPMSAGIGVLALLGTLLVPAFIDTSAALASCFHRAFGKPAAIARLAGRAPACQSTDVVVAIPVLINESNHRGCRSLLEARHLQGGAHGLRFCLLTDFEDASEKNVEAEAAIMARLTADIASLNKVHGPKSDLFFHIHRHRIWRESEGLWTGRECKRGKLSAFNALLRDNYGHGIDPSAHRSWMDGVRFVMVLDADTDLDTSTVRTLVEVLDHPDNRPLVDPLKGRVVSGYSIAQPAMRPKLNTATTYGFWGGNALQHVPSDRRTFDIHQGFIGEGTFFGKGLYNVDVFEATTRDAFPDNLILSHDLPEGCAARVVNVPEAVIFEPAAATYLSELNRKHRWFRGDWQNLLWMLGSRRVVSLTPISAWKIVDNVRRNISPVFLLAALGLGFWVVPDPARWLVAIAGVLLLPIAVRLVMQFFCGLNGGNLHPARLGRLASREILSGAIDLSRKLFDLILIGHHAWLAISAIATSNWRTFVTKRRILEWRPSGACSAASQDLKGHFREIFPSAAIAAAVTFAPAWARPEHAYLFATIALLSLAAPALAWLADRPLRRLQPAMPASDGFVLPALEAGQ